MRMFRQNFWIRVCQGKDDRIFSHDLDHFFGQNARSRKTEEHVCTRNHVTELSSFDVLYIGFLGFIQAFTMRSQQTA
ncbi:Uncharacterised protein [Klebsiella pneumoniae]|nr:Uncharacterised protein [Klebsiella pneumoniae]